MNLKLRFSLLFSLLFSIILASVMLVVYTLFARFRIEEFKDRLEEKARTTIRLLIKVKEVDDQLLKIIDRNTINQLYNEKILIFNDKLELVYSSIDDAPVTWTKKELEKIRQEKSILRKNGEYEVYGMFYDTRVKDYYALVSAEDKYGKSKLRYLRILLTFAFVAGSLLVWFLSYYVSKKALLPLDKFRNKIITITEKNLNEKLPASTGNNEIGVLSNAFNQMLDRINTSYSRQKEFTSNASHELRTPITRIVTQLENLMQNPATPPATNEILREISAGCYQLSDIISSLLILSKMDNNPQAKGFQPVRLDEVIFYAEEQLKKLYPDFKFQFEIESTADDINIELNGDETLLRIAIGNLLKNGYLYSSDGIVQCVMKPRAGMIELQITNRGETPQVADTSLLFNTFTRGKNVQHKAGSGLGLSLVKRILDYHQAHVEYRTPEMDVNQLVVRFHL
ncbi:MAG: HAMP domain-containing protein [Williamsia sp.]|nr:HAMP domain-containing protein [Williamsia sp.]